MVKNIYSKILILCFFCYSIPVFSYEYSYYPIRNKNTYLTTKNTDFSQLNRNYGNNLSILENYVFKKSYKKESPIKRLERLENIAFGSIQQGDIDLRYKNVEQAILSRANYDNYKRNSILNTLGNYFGGQVTGFTPSVFPQYPYNNYGTQRIDQFSNGIFGNGYRVYNQDFGNNSSVKIID
jgi:hypothetical protein